MTQLYMLDTNICSFIMRERPAEVLGKLGEDVVDVAGAQVGAVAARDEAENHCD